MIPEADALSSLQARMHTTARSLQLPLRNRSWRGAGGNWSGSGTGSSIDFQDHRPYYPGDDPRHIDWKAYARTGNYTMKLFREEVSPSVDLALDLSASMFLDEAKTTRTLELFYFAAASALRLRGALRCYLVSGERIVALDGAAAFSRPPLVEAFEHGGGVVLPALEKIPWRAGALRVWISDLLFPGNPSLSPLAAGKGRGLILAPYSNAEATPEWSGNLELVDCETGARRTQRVEPALLADYSAAYARHFQLWRAEARRMSVGFARVAAEPGFLEAITEEALPQGAVEPV